MAKDLFDDNLKRIINAKLRTKDDTVPVRITLVTLHLESPAACRFPLFLLAIGPCSPEHWWVLEFVSIGDFVLDWM